MTSEKSTAHFLNGLAKLADAGAAYLNYKDLREPAEIYHAISSLRGAATCFREAAGKGGEG